MGVRVEARPDLDFIKSQGIAMVNLEPGTPEIPAAIGLRSFLKRIEHHGDGGVVDHWTATLSPMAPNLQRRLLAERNPTRMGDIDPLDAPLPGFLSAGYDAVEELRKGHQPFSDLQPPREGTVVEVTYALVMGRHGRLEPVIGFHTSTTKALERIRWMMLKRQQQEDDIFSGACWPLKGPLFFTREDAQGNEIGRTQLWPWGRKRKSLDIPDLPKDPWGLGGESYPDVGMACARMEMIFNSLWRAVFVMDERVAGQLIEQGYNLDQVEGTCLGVGPLVEMMSPRIVPANLTQLGNLDNWFDEEGMDEISSADIQRLATHGTNTHFDVEIEDE
jgi:hypothetical protein